MYIGGMTIPGMGPLMFGSSARACRASRSASIPAWSLTALKNVIDPSFCAGVWPNGTSIRSGTGGELIGVIGWLRSGSVGFQPPPLPGTKKNLAMSTGGVRGGACRRA